MSARSTPGTRFRRDMLGALRKVVKALRVQVTVWNAPPSLTWFADPDGVERWHAEPRKREEIAETEWPENDPERLRRLIGWSRHLSRELQAIARAADERHRELTGKGVDE